jgi:hypothetical protein
VEEHVGWEYTDPATGKKRFVSRLAGDFELPDGAIATPRMKSHKVYIPRFIVEEYKVTGPHPGLYHKCWEVAEVKVEREHAGRVDLASHYREPAEVDVQMCAHLARLRDTLTEEEIRKAVEQQKASQAAEKARLREEMVDEIAHETAKALTDGIPGASTKYGYDPNLRPNIPADAGRHSIAKPKGDL